MERADRLSAEIPVVGRYDQRSELTDSHIVSMIVPQGFCCRYPDRGRLILSRLLHKEFIRTRCSLRQTSQGTQQFGVHCSICLCPQKIVQCELDIGVIFDLCQGFSGLASPFRVTVILKLIDPEHERFLCGKAVAFLSVSRQLIIFQGPFSGIHSTFQSPREGHSISISAGKEVLFAWTVSRFPVPSIPA